MCAHFIGSRSEVDPITAARWNESASTWSVAWSAKAGWARSTRRKSSYRGAGWALKILRPELASSEAGRQMFLTEMTILAHLDHPNIVRSLACTELEGQLVMALEYLEGCRAIARSGRRASRLGTGPRIVPGSRRIVADSLYCN